MSWVPRITPGQAGPELAATYDAIRARSSRGQVSHLWQVLAHDRAGLDALLAQARALVVSPAPLSPAQAELIAVTVSATNGCAYCVAHHGPRLAGLVGEPLAREVARDYREANLAARDRVLLDAAVALTCEPAERKQEDVERLREYGFDDVAIVKATEITAYFNAVNRLVCALGVELEADLVAWEFGAQR